MAQIHPATMLFKKQSSVESRAVGSVETFGVYVLEGYSYPDGFDAKESGSQVWLDENGTDSYDAKKLFANSNEAKIPFGCKGKTTRECKSKMDLIVDYLTGKTSSDGILHLMYFPHTGFGKSGVRLKKVDNISIDDCTEDVRVMTFDITFSIDDPTSMVEVSSTDTTFDLIKI